MIRLLLTVVVAAVVVLVLAAMLWGWQRRAARQDVLLPDLDTSPPAEPDLGELVAGPHTGLYVGTTFATSWQDRVVVGGLGRRASATASLYRGGAVFERRGDTPVFLPWAVIDGARVEPALAGKVLGKGGLLVLRWHHATGSDLHLLDTGFRADDRRAYLEWVTALDAPALLPPASPPTSHEPRESAS
ncbi:PH-like domain-containing protein [Jatrophihabitans sp. YIM 134969]